MSIRALLMTKRVLDESGEAVRTPAGAKADLIRSYGPWDLFAATPYGLEIPARR
jgi:hypothetical protein